MLLSCSFCDSPSLSVFEVSSGRVCSPCHSLINESNVILLPEKLRPRRQKVVNVVEFAPYGRQLHSKQKVQLAVCVRHTVKVQLPANSCRLSGLRGVYFRCTAPVSGQICEPIRRSLPRVVSICPRGPHELLLKTDAWHSPFRSSSRTLILNNHWHS